MTYNEQKIQEEFRKMKATGIVRRIDDLGRVVIPKEIRKTLRIKEGTPLEIFTDREGQIILKKYSPIGELNTFAAEYAEALVQTTGLTACITDRDQVVAACGSGSGNWKEKRSVLIWMQSLPAGKAEWSVRTAGKIYQSFPTLWIHFARK